MRTAYYETATVKHILAALTRPNRLACEVCLRYGLRIGDVLKLRKIDVEKGSVTVVESKTGKRRRIVWTDELRNRLIGESGKVFVFENRLDYRKHRTRQAVFKDLKRAAKAFRVNVNLSVHSLRKCFAVEDFKRFGDLARVQKLLNHSNEAVTIIYAMADEVQRRKKKIS